jgi:hypothetical protein
MGAGFHRWRIVTALAAALVPAGMLTYSGSAALAVHCC